MAVSYAWHNPQFGEGGLRQVYMHEMQSLIERGVLEMEDKRPMTNMTARLAPCVRHREVRRGCRHDRAIAAGPRTTTAR